MAVVDRVCFKQNKDWLRMLTLAAALVVIFSLAAAVPAGAQLATQTINLQTGWNAVFLEVQPSPDGSDSVFSEMPVEGVWAWSKRSSPVQFIQDPSTLLPPRPDWLAWFPVSAPHHELTDLWAIRGGRAYLIKVSAPVTWRITGKALVRPPEWVADSWNLVGFPVDPANPPTARDYFSGAVATFTAKPIYRLDAAGAWQVMALTERGAAWGWRRRQGGTKAT